MESKVVQIVHVRSLFLQGQWDNSLNSKQDSQWGVGMYIDKDLIDSDALSIPAYQFLNRLKNK